MAEGLGKIPEHACVARVIFVGEEAHIVAERGEPFEERGEGYANPPLKRGKTVLVVNDFCTEFNSSEAARAYIAGFATLGAFTWFDFVRFAKIQGSWPTRCIGRAPQRLRQPRVLSAQGKESDPAREARR
jgi:hypothetical protein